MKSRGNPNGPTSPSERLVGTLLWLNWWTLSSALVAYSNSSHWTKTSRIRELVDDRLNGSNFNNILCLEATRQIPAVPSRNSQDIGGLKLRYRSGVIELLVAVEPSRLSSFQGAHAV